MNGPRERDASIGLEPRAVGRSTSTWWICRARSSKPRAERSSSDGLAPLRIASGEGLDNRGSARLAGDLQGQAWGNSSGRHEGTQSDRLAQDVANLVARRTRGLPVGNRRVVGKQLMGMKLKAPDQQQLWAEAQRRCRLSDEAVRMAKELGIGPRSLIKNIPARTQQWKSPVEDWVRDLYDKRQRKAARKNPGIDAGEVDL